MESKISSIKGNFESLLASAKASKRINIDAVIPCEDVEVILNALEASMPCRMVCEEKTREITEEKNPFASTVDSMLSHDYKERFKAEYYQTKIRYERLKAFNNRIEDSMMKNVVEPKHDCPAHLLREQQHAMGEYLHILEVRAIIEGVEL